MKKFFLKPGFEFMFSLSLMVILGLPPMLLAQNQKNIQIKIENRDTIVNGKNIKDLSATERQNALKDIEQINNDHNQNVYFFKRKDTTGGKIQHFRFKTRGRDSGERETMITETTIIKDSLGNIVAVRPGNHRTMAPKMSFKYRDFDDSPDRMELRGRNFGTRPRLMSPFERKNSQNFDYVKTDNEGISTHVRFHVSEVSDDDLKKIPHVEGSKFEIYDVNLVPEFSSGKTLLMFNLPAKTPSEVKLFDSEGKLIWNDKAMGGSFSKKFMLSLNGIYYLQIKQNKVVAIKRIMKEE